MAKKSNNKTRGISLIELLNKATSSEDMSSGAVKDQIGEIKRLVRKNNWQGRFSKMLAQSPNWVELAEETGVRYIVDKDGKEKGVFPIIRNNMAMLKVVM